jgi:molecular chaperone DnaK
LSVSAKDLGTGKAQSVRIEQSSGLSDKDIEKMRQDAQSHADEDHHKRQLAESRNQAESMCWQLEKTMKEHEAKLSAGDKEAMTKAIENVRAAAKGDNLEAIKSAISQLEAASHAFSKSLYERATAGAQPGAAPGGAPGAGPEEKAPGGDDDTIDAEFEVKDKK